MFKHSKNKLKLSTISKTKHKLKKKNKYSKQKSFVKYSKKYNLNGGAGKNPRTNGNSFKNLINKLLVKLANIGQFIDIKQITELFETIENMTDMNKEFKLFRKLQELHQILPNSMYNDNNNNEIKRVKKESLIEILNKIIPDIINDIVKILNARKNNAIRQEIRQEPKIMDKTNPFFSSPSASASATATATAQPVPLDPSNLFYTPTTETNPPIRRLPETPSVAAATIPSIRRLPKTPTSRTSATLPTTPSTTQTETPLSTLSRHSRQQAMKRTSATKATSATQATPATFATPATPFVDSDVLPIIFESNYPENSHDNFTNKSLSFLTNNERKMLKGSSTNKQKKYNNLGRNITGAGVGNNYTPLYNIGNSCYLNSVLQMLFSIPDVKDLIKNPALPVNNEIINSMKILVEYFYDGRAGHNGSRYKAGQILNIDDKPRMVEFPELAHSRQSRQLPVFPTIYDQIYYKNLAPYAVNDVGEYIKYLFNSITDLDNIMNFSSTELRTCQNRRTYYTNLLDNILSIPISNKEYQDAFIEYRRYLESIYTVKTSNEINQIKNRKEAEEQKKLSDENNKIIQDGIIDFLQNPLQYQRPRQPLLNQSNQQEQQITLQDCINKSFAEEIYDPAQNSRSDECGKDREGRDLPLEKHQILSYTTKKFIILAINRFFYLHGDATGYKIFWEITPNPIIQIPNGGGIEKIYKLKSCIIHVGNRLSTGHYIYLNFNDNGIAKDIIDDDKIYNYNGDVKSRYNGKFEPNHNYLRNGYVYLYEEI